MNVVQVQTNSKQINPNKYCLNLLTIYSFFFLSSLKNEIYTDDSKFAIWGWVSYRKLTFIHS